MVLLFVYFLKTFPGTKKTLLIFLCFSCNMFSSKNSQSFISVGSTSMYSTNHIHQKYSGKHCISTEHIDISPFRYFLNNNLITICILYISIHIKHDKSSRDYLKDVYRLYVDTMTSYIKKSIICEFGHLQCSWNQSP
jgi:hypothetical protein